MRRDLLDNHRTYCNLFQYQKLHYPVEGKNDILEFKDFEKCTRVPFVIYADFECYAKRWIHVIQIQIKTQLRQLQSLKLADILM